MTAIKFKGLYLHIIKMAKFDIYLLKDVGEVWSFIGGGEYCIQE